MARRQYCRLATPATALWGRQEPGLNQCMGGRTHCFGNPISGQLTFICNPDRNVLFCKVENLNTQGIHKWVEGKYMRLLHILCGIFPNSSPLISILFYTCVYGGYLQQWQTLSIKKLGWWCCLFLAYCVTGGGWSTALACLFNNRKCLNNKRNNPTRQVSLRE